jgi:hypothetical protein
MIKEFNAEIILSSVTNWQVSLPGGGGEDQNYAPC